MPALHLAPAAVQFPPAVPGSVAEMAKGSSLPAAASNPVHHTRRPGQGCRPRRDAEPAKDIRTLCSPRRTPPRRRFRQRYPVTDEANPTGASRERFEVPRGRWNFDPSEPLPVRNMTFEGQNITVTGSGESFTVNGTAQVVCGNVKTANATVYV